MVSRDDKYIQLEGGGGHVSVNTSLEHGETEVDIQSQEWERQAQRFLDRL
jgi:hypothetical protein